MPTDSLTTRNEAADLREWSWLMDNAEEGTAFVTDDPYNSQRPIVGGLSKSMARAIVDDHNVALRHAHQQGRAERWSREVLLYLLSAHYFHDEQSGWCDCEEWPKAGDNDRYHHDHLLSVLLDAIAADATASEPGERT